MPLLDMANAVSVNFPTQDEVVIKSPLLPGLELHLPHPNADTLALTDSMGTPQTSYMFEPFGNTTASGAPSTNSFAYTGRELDRTGVYYYRARYYSPALQRFISEDPLGLGGGANFYA